MKPLIKSTEQQERDARVMARMHEIYYEALSSTSSLEAALARLCRDLATKQGSVTTDTNKVAQELYAAFLQYESLTDALHEAAARQACLSSRRGS